MLDDVAPRERRRIAKYLEGSWEGPGDEPGEVPDDVLGLIWEDLFADL